MFNEKSFKWKKKIRGGINKEHTVKNNKNKKKQLIGCYFYPMKKKNNKKLCFKSLGAKDELAHKFIKRNSIIIYEVKT